MAFVAGRGAAESIRAARRAAGAERAQPSFGRARPGGNLHARQPLTVCPELDCLRHRLPPRIIAAAERRAAEVGTGADRVLVCNGTISDDAYALALAASLRTIFNTLELPRSACRLSDARVLEGVTAGLLPLDLDGRRVLVVSLRALAARKLIALLKSNPQLARDFHITTDQHLKRFIMRAAPQAVAQKAANELRIVRPEMSAATRSSFRPLALASMVGIGAALAAPTFFMTAVEAVLTVVFLAWAGLRFLGTCSRDVQEPESPPLSDANLPVYTVVVALYREATCVAGLVRALNALDYPGLMAQTPLATARPLT